MQRSPDRQVSCLVTQLNSRLVKAPRPIRHCKNWQDDHDRGQHILPWFRDRANRPKYHQAARPSSIDDSTAGASHRARRALLSIRPCPLGRLAVAAITATALSLFHVIDVTMMILMWNLGTAVLLIGLGGLFGRRMFRWVAPRTLSPQD